MTITLDAASSSTSSVLETSRSWSHTVGSSRRNRCLFVTLGAGAGAGAVGGSATYGGVAMTACASITSPTYSLLAVIFYLVNPPTGSNTVAVSWTNDAYASCAALSLYGVSQASPVGAEVEQAATTSGVSLAIPITGGGWAIDAVSTDVGDAGLIVGAGQTVLVNSSTFRGAASYQAYTSGDTSIAMTWSKTVGRQSIACGVPINASSGQASPTVSPFLRF